MERWITVFLDGDYYKNKFKSIFTTIVHPIVKLHGGTNARCVTFENMTEAEYKFADLATAKAARTAIRKEFKKIKIPGRSIVTIMPDYYEKNGSRGIVRPDYHSEGPPLKPIPRFKI